MLKHVALELKRLSWLRPETQGAGVFSGSVADKHTASDVQGAWPVHNNRTTILICHVVRKMIAHHRGIDPALHVYCPTLHRCIHN